MKKSIKAIAAAASALTLALSCVPMTYAVEDVPAAQTETETAEKTSVEFTLGKELEAPYNGTVMLSSDDGTAYYHGCESNSETHRLIIYTLDESGGIKHSFSVYSYVNDKGEKIGMTNYSLKQVGEYLYLLYSEATGFNSLRDNVIIKLDKELNQIESYRAPKGWNIDTNGEKIVYMKANRTIYSTDMDGSNKQLLYTAGQDGKLYGLNFIAVSGDYAGFQGKWGDSVSPKNDKDYCGIINLKTGEVTLKEQRSVQQLYNSNGKVIWFSSEWRDIRESASIQVPEGEDPEEYCREHMEKYREYFDDGESYVLDNGEFYVLKTQSPVESRDLTVDNDGNVITYNYYDYGKKGNWSFKIYRDNKLIGTYSTDLAGLKGICGFTANNGIITVSYSGREPNYSSSDWTPIDPNMTDEEYEKLAARSPAVGYNDTVKTITINYSVNE